MAGRSADGAVHERRRRLRLDVTGAVQGVGFRPFVHRLAVAERLAGFVHNTMAGASLEIEGAPGAIRQFLKRLDAEIQPPAKIEKRHSIWLPLRQEQGFVVAPSAVEEHPRGTILPDLAACEQCVGEVLESANRRYRYPFTTCTGCGPRYSIIESLPYDRERTAMRRFRMCAECQSEYENPDCRRFHAETLACAQCGPRLSLRDQQGRELAAGDPALRAAEDAVRNGLVVAVKGLGGFQLIVDPRNANAVRSLRERKQRPAKPFALMVASVDEARGLANVSKAEERLLTSSAGPIVLLRAREGPSALCRELAPGNGRLGMMLPTTPLHHLLLRDLGFPVIATSGNRGGEPVAFDETTAIEDLASVADVFLVHDRPIVRPVDDSVALIVGGEPTVLRHARGYAPQRISASRTTTSCVALGGHQKSAVAIASDRQIILGPHIGDMNNSAARSALARTGADFSDLHATQSDVVACDTHPDYYSTRLAERMGPAVIRVPHHLAHVLACKIDNGIDEPVLGVSWDGAGYGDDGTVWGGEFLVVAGSAWRRIARLVPFRLPGGDVAAREPRRAALGLLHAIHGEATFTMKDVASLLAFSSNEREVLSRMLARGVNSPLCSSAGRLFDGVAAILGLCQTASFEGEAAMAVEAAAATSSCTLRLPVPVLSTSDVPWSIDWRDTLSAMVRARCHGVPPEPLAAGFHEALAEAIVNVARHVGIDAVLLTGGCFQNARLVESTVVRLRQGGLQPYWHHRIPPNDGGLAAGQAVFACNPIMREH